MTISDTPGEGALCSDCPPVGYPTDKTRCAPCPRTAGPSDHAGLVERLSNALDPEIGLPSDYLLRCIHADLEIRGRKNPDFAVTVHHRNIVLSAVAEALRSSSLLTWDEWLEHAEAIAALSRAPEAVAVGWAYREKRWHGEHWHLCKEEPNRIEGREVERVYLAPPAPQPALALIEEMERALGRMVNERIAPGAGLFAAAMPHDMREQGEAALASAKRFKEGA